MQMVSTNIGRSVDTEWIKTNQEQIQTHIALHPDISEKEAEKLLSGKSSYTYLLRAGEREHFYFISFVKKDGFIKHQFFLLEFDRGVWFYRNGTGCGSPQEMVSRDLDKLIPMMMHCNLVSCTPLIRCKYSEWS